jgi:hypothetical protein
MNSARRYKNLRYFYIISFAATGFFLPLSEWFLSAAIILMAIGALILSLNGEYRYDRRFSGAMIFSVIYLVHVVWMIRTSDIGYGLSELRLKLPLLIIPLAVASVKPLNPDEKRLIMFAFCAGVIASTLAGTINLLVSAGSGTIYSERISPFISHIRLALMVLVAANILLIDFSKSDVNRFRLPALISLIWLFVFIFILQSLTGIILLVFSLICVSFFFPTGTYSREVKRFSSVILLTLVLTATVSLFREARLFMGAESKIKALIVDSDSSVTRYTHYRDRHDMENGFPVWINICEPELRKEWNKRSSLKYDSADKRGQEVKYTLIRYMTSLGLKKDSAGIASLGETDIQAVENGYGSTVTAGRNLFRAKIYETVWQFYNYYLGGNPSGHSLTQRLVFFSTAWKVFKANPVAGVGTGDLPAEFRKQYDAGNTLLEAPYRLLSHNQFLTFMCMFGLSGFLVIVLAVILPLLRLKVLRNYLSTVVFLIIVFSMLWEDTLATHTGISFFAYFYAFFTFGANDE